MRQGSEADEVVEAEVSASNEVEELAEVTELLLVVLISSIVDEVVLVMKDCDAVTVDEATSVTAEDGVAIVEDSEEAVELAISDELEVSAEMMLVEILVEEIAEEGERAGYVDT